MLSQFVEDIIGSYLVGTYSFINIAAHYNVCEQSIEWADIVLVGLYENKRFTDD